jgi:hypothetical protein
MQDFPKLIERNFVKTREKLHSVAKIFGKFRENLVKPTVKNENLWLRVFDNGFQIPIMEQYGNLMIRCNLDKLRIEVVNAQVIYTIDLEDNSVYGIKDELVRILNELNIQLDQDRISFKADDKIELERDSSIAFLNQLVNYNWLLQSFWDSIKTGSKTGICFWPEHFDNAFIWYSGRKANGFDRQIGIGVSNGDGEISFPYIYINPWPVLEGIDKVKLTEGAYMHSKGWIGFVLPYNPVVNKNGYEQQKELINNFFISTFEKISKKFTV